MRRDDESVPSSVLVLRPPSSGIHQSIGVMNRTAVWSLKLAHLNLSCIDGWSPSRSTDGPGERLAHDWLRQTDCLADWISGWLSGSDRASDRVAACVAEQASANDGMAIRQ